MCVALRCWVGEVWLWFPSPAVLHVAQAAFLPSKRDFCKMLGLIPALQKCFTICSRVEQTVYLSKACWIEKGKYHVFGLQQKTRNFIRSSPRQSLSQPELRTPSYSLSI